MVEKMLKKSISYGKIKEVVSQILDPEISFLTIIELGILRKIECGDSNITVVIAPTYLACPATDVIEENIRSCLVELGCQSVDVIRQFDPAWTTNWITKEGREKMRLYGISPPPSVSVSPNCGTDAIITCPRCDASDSECLSEVSGTLCKSLFRCTECLEVFEQFKCL